MLGRGGDDDHGVDVSLGQHLPVIGVDIRDAQLLLGIFQLSGHDGAGGGQFGVGDLVGDILGMDLAKAAQANNADAKLLHKIIPPYWGGPQVCFANEPRKAGDAGGFVPFALHYNRLQ